MPDTKKFLDSEGLKVLWQKISLGDYPNNDTLVTVINAIDENKQDKITGTEKQVAGFNINGKLIAKDLDETLSQVGVPADAKAVGDVIAELSDRLSSDYNESIIGLSIDGQTITYIKGDGSQHTIITQDTDTTYSIGTDEITGLTKLYATTGSAEDGTMTQKAIKTELDKKVGVSIDNSQDMLIFTI